MEVLFTSWDNDLYVRVPSASHIPRKDEYMRFNLPEGKTTPWMRVAHVSYEYFSIYPEEIRRAHVYLEEIDGDPPFFRE